MTIVTRAGTLTIEDAPRVNRCPRATLTLARVAVDRVGRPATATLDRDVMANPARVVMAMLVRVVTGTRIRVVRAIPARAATVTVARVATATVARVAMAMLGPSGTGRAGPVVTGRAGRVERVTGAASTLRVRARDAHPIGRPGGFVRAGQTVTMFPATTTRAFRRM
ncbi:hypothetical protein [Microcella putealis]|uniref:hypothetical protein n=1 Tax=Microcella putealis TaxID=337005 RepID=UPI001639F66D|nr:hypothetical protein [Microcella putealis]